MTNRRRWVGGRQPEKERKDSRFDAERDEKEHRQRCDQARLDDACVKADGQVGHVERAGHAVEDADRGQEER